MCFKCDRDGIPSLRINLSESFTDASDDSLGSNSGLLDDKAIIRNYYVVVALSDGVGRNMVILFKVIGEVLVDLIEGRLSEEFSQNIHRS